MKNARFAQYLLMADLSYNTVIALFKKHKVACIDLEDISRRSTLKPNDTEQLFDLISDEIVLINTHITCVKFSKCPLAINYEE